MARIHLKPARRGLRVINPATNVPLPDEGAHVVPGQYWNRRLRDGDVVRVKGGARKSSARQTAPQQTDDEAEG